MAKIFSSSVAFIVVRLVDVTLWDDLMSGILMACGSSKVERIFRLGIVLTEAGTLWIVRDVFLGIKWSSSE